MTIKLSDEKGYFEVISKPLAEQLINQAISEIEINGVSTKKLVIHKKHIINGDFLLEVGVIKEEPISSPSVKDFMKVKRDDTLLKAVDKLQSLIAK